MANAKQKTSGKTRTTAAKQPPRKERILKLVAKRKNGATASELTESLGMEPHRASDVGADLKVLSTGRGRQLVREKNEDGVWVYYVKG